MGYGMNNLNILVNTDFKSVISVHIQSFQALQKLWGFYQSKHQLSDYGKSLHNILPLHKKLITRPDCMVLAGINPD